jgi:hypothetical protein
MIVIDVGQIEKQNRENGSTDEGIEIDRSTAHSENARSPRVESRAPGSNATSVSAMQPQKHCSQICSTDAGMQIDRSERQHANAERPSDETIQPCSNSKFERSKQSAKHPLAMI